MISLQSYGSSDDSDSESGIEKNGKDLPSSTNSNRSSEIEKVKMKLPSANDLLNGCNPPAWIAKPIPSKTIELEMSKPKHESGNNLSDKSNNLVSSLKPPQLTKPNVVTEDMTSWTSKNKREIDKDSLDNSKKKPKTFNQKEKLKRDIGQTSRAKSFVEEEKRLLRESKKSIS
mmetsp:Transcript_28421/g.28729  ORF Transcript_28421/g.28729 Transcript_28421/m.28729 type:complete len:173 (+) Transcript_28421:74-592(+)